MHIKSRLFWILIVSFAVFSVPSAHAQSDMDDADWSATVEVLYEQGFDTVGLCVSSLIPTRVIRSAEKELCMAHFLFNWPGFDNEMYIRRTYSLGSLVKMLLIVKYADYPDEERDYYITRFSDDKEDYLSFLSTYPNTIHREEMERKRQLLTHYSNFSKGKADLGPVPECTYVGFSNLYKNMRRKLSSEVASKDSPNIIKKGE